MERAKREMNFDEEYEILKEEVEELFGTENIDSEPPFSNCVVRRALRCIDKLKRQYKDAEEQGLLLRLPCKVGDAVWWINSIYAFSGVKRVDEEIVKSFIFDEDGLTIVMSGIAMGEYGKTVFLTREEAEQRLKEMESE